MQTSPTPPPAPPPLAPPIIPSNNHLVTPLDDTYANTNILGSLYNKPVVVTAIPSSLDVGAIQVDGRVKSDLLSALNDLSTVRLKKVTETRDVSAPALWRAKQVYETRKLEEKLNKEFLLQLPVGYDDDKEKRWPLILYLHGSDHRGNDISIIKGCGPPSFREQHPDFPFVVLSPQCTLGFHNGWEGTFSSLDNLLDNIITNYRIDADRVSVTGLSMGGYGTWAIALEYPHRFAAIVPVCGGGTPNKINEKHRFLSAWIFQGTADHIVALQEPLAMKTALEKVGGEVKMSLAEGLDHCTIIDHAYQNPDLYKWLLTKQRRIN